MKIVITMTSWTKRIDFVSKAIFRFIKSQTVKPDIFYLWLAEEEFPNKEKDLPEDLLLICDTFDIKICWIKENEYCHKRWYVYPEHYEDLVISIDDDVFYDPDLIKTAIEFSKKYENCIINSGDALYPALSFNKSIDRIFIKAKLDMPSNDIQLCGQCIVLPKSFPLDALSKNNVLLRKEFCKLCDECWLTPFIHNSTTKIMIHKWNNQIITNMQDTCTWKKIIKIKSLQLYIALRCNKSNFENWKKIFPKYDDSKYKNKTLKDLLNLCKI